MNSMRRAYRLIINFVYLLIATLLIVSSVAIIFWSGFIVIKQFSFGTNSIAHILHSLSALVISMAIIDVAKYMFEEEIFRSKELRSPKEARKTLTKIFVIISITVSLEGLVYIFKAGERDITLLPYPAVLVVAGVFSMLALGIFQKITLGEVKGAGTGIDD